MPEEKVSRKHLVDRSLLDGIRNFMRRRFDQDRLIKYQDHFIREIDRIMAEPPAADAGPRQPSQPFDDSSVCDQTKLLHCPSCGGKNKPAPSYAPCNHPWHAPPVPQEAAASGTVATFMDMPIRLDAKMPVGQVDVQDSQGRRTIIPATAPDAGPRPRTRHEFNQGTGFCEICGGHNTHVRSEYCLPPPKRPAVPQEARELTKAEWKEIAEGPCEAEDDDLSLDAKATAQLAESESANNGENKQGAPTSALASSDPQIEQLRKEKHLAALTIAAQLAQLAEKEREISRDYQQELFHAEGRAEQAEQRLQEAQVRALSAEESLRQREAELEQRWIAVEDRLPEAEEKVLVLRSNDYPKIDAEWYTKRGRWDSGFFNDGEQDTNVTHWQPLPSPPKEAES